MAVDPRSNHNCIGSKVDFGPLGRETDATSTVAVDQHTGCLGNKSELYAGIRRSLRDSHYKQPRIPAFVLVIVQPARENGIP